MAYAAYWTSLSQSKQSTPTPVAPAFSVKPAEYEKGAAGSAAGSAAKPGSTTAPVSKTTTSTFTTSTAKAPSVSVATVGPTVTSGGGGSTSGTSVTQSEPSKVTPQAPSASATKAPAVSAGSGAAGGIGTTGTAAGVAGVSKPSTDTVKPKETSSGKDQSTNVSSSKPEPSKMTNAGLAKPSVTASVAGSSAQTEVNKPKDAKVKVEVPTPATKTTTQAPDADPFDALAGSLPSSDPVAPKVPQYTGPEVKERGMTSKVANRCGELEHTLPPGYRKEDMEKKIPAVVPEKPKEVSKPLTIDEAVESLSAGFVSSAAPSAPKPEVKQQAAVSKSVSSAPLADTKLKVEKTDKVKANEDKKSTSTTPDKPKEVNKKEEMPAPPVDKKAKVEKPKANEGDSMSLDALSALSDTLPEAKPVPEPPKLRPKDIIDEKKVKSEEGVRVGERDDTLPPDYRFTEEKGKKQPAPPKEPSLDPAEALDILSGDFSSPSVAPSVQAPVPPTAPANQKSKVEDLSALDALAGEFVAPKQSNKVASAALPAAATVAKSTPKPKPDQGASMSLDALSALEDTLPSAKPPPESPKIKPEDFVHEDKLKSEKGVRVGEREDTLPPDYRFPKDKLPKEPAPPPQREPSMDPAEALDILSGDFDSSSVAPAVQAPLPPSAPPADSLADFALEELAGDFVAPMNAPKIHSAATVPPKADRQLSEGTSSAMDALSDTLMDICPAPEPVPVSPKDVVKEMQAKEEKLIKTGERDDTLPPDYRPTEADIKAAAEAKAKAKMDVPKQPSIDESAALDMLSSDFSAAPPAVPVAPCAAPKTASSAKTPTTHTQPQGPVLDKLASTLLPDFPETKGKDSKPKARGGKSKAKQKKPADDGPSTAELSGPASTDVVSTSTKKGGKS